MKLVSQEKLRTTWFHSHVGHETETHGHGHQCGGPQREESGRGGWWKMKKKVKTRNKTIKWFPLPLLMFSAAEDGKNPVIYLQRLLPGVWNSYSLFGGQHVAIYQNLKRTYIHSELAIALLGIDMTNYPLMWTKFHIWDDHCSIF